MDSGPTVPSEPARPLRRSELAAWGFIIAIIGFFLALIPYFGIVTGLLIGIPATILGFIAQIKLKKNPSLTGKNLSRIAVILGIISILISLSEAIYLWNLGARSNPADSNIDTMTRGTMIDALQRYYSSSSVVLVPNVYQIPPPLYIGSSTEIVNQGIDFRVPWPNAIQKTGNAGLSIQDPSSSRKAALFNDDYLFYNFIVGGNLWSAKDQSTTEAFFGPNILMDKYTLYQDILENTPQSVENATNSVEINARIPLLPIKDVIAANATQINSFTKDTIKGFEINNASGSIVLYLFNGSGAFRTISIQGSQDDANYIISAVKFF